MAQATNPGSRAPSGPGSGGPASTAAAVNAPTTAEGAGPGAGPTSGTPTGGATASGAGARANSNAGGNGSGGSGPAGSEAESPGSGGTGSTAAAVNAPTTAEGGGSGSQTDYLARILNIQDAPVKAYGWIENSYTGNTNGTPRNDSNFSVFPNKLANRWQGNQYYLILERTLRQNDSINFGGRFDTLFGNDWQFTKSYGLFDREFVNGHFAGLDLPQIFGEVHLPVLTKNGFDIRGGRFFSPAGFENVQAVKRPLPSVPYLFNYTPFTLFGVLTTLHINDRTNIYNGAVNGWDRWIDQNYRYSYLGGFSYNSRDLKTAVTSIVLTGPDQLPRFAPFNSPFLPTGVPTNIKLQGQVDPNYAGNWRTYESTVLTHTWNDKLTEAVEVFFVHETNVAGVGPTAKVSPETPKVRRRFNGPVLPESAWYGAAHWYLYNFTPKVQGVFRAEIFHDQNGLATGQADNYYEITLGLPYKPKPWLWIRPEARYDWAQYHHPFNDGTRESQFLLAFDVIVQF